MARTSLGSRKWLAIGLSAVSLAGLAFAQESLDKGKTPAQLFASDCAPCHKSPQGLAKSGGLFGLDGFLREHYTASREAATAIANYLKSMDTGPAGPGRASKRAAKGDDKAKSEGTKKPATKPDETKGAEKTRYRRGRAKLIRTEARRHFGA